VECDVRLAKDQVPVIFHDEAVRLPDGREKPIRELDHKRLGTIDIGGGEAIPTLKEALRRFGVRLFFDVEIKELDAVKKVLNIINTMSLSGRTMVSSFIPEALQTARDIAPQIERGLLVDRLTGGIMGGKSAIKAAAMLGCAFFLPDYRALSGKWVTAAQSEGMKVVPWTVNRLEDGKALIENGVDGLISDRPDQFHFLLRS